MLLNHETNRCRPKKRVLGCCRWESSLRHFVGEIVCGYVMTILDKAEVIFFSACHNVLWYYCMDFWYAIAQSSCHICDTQEYSKSW
jgi:hypothetical protein